MQTSRAAITYQQPPTPKGLGHEGIQLLLQIGGAVAGGKQNATALLMFYPPAFDAIDALNTSRMKFFAVFRSGSAHRFTFI
jgi:hypothetical protein